MATTTDNLPPQNLDAERSVLGSLLRDNEVINDVAPSLAAEHYYSDSHRKIYEAIRHLYDKAQRVDTVLLAEELNLRGQIEDIGGYGYLAELWDAAPTAANAVHYAEIVKNKAGLRSLIHVSTEVLRDAYMGGATAQSISESTQERLFALSFGAFRNEPVHVSAAVNVACERIEARGRGERTGLLTGFKELDALTSGFQPCELILVAARPSIGKTALALALSRKLLLNGNPGLFASLEQPHVDLGERLIAAEAGVNMKTLREGKPSPEEWQRILAARESMADWPFWIADEPSQTAAQIAAQARRFHRRHGIKFVVVDYLQLAVPEDRRVQRYEQVGAIVKHLRLRLARPLAVSVILLAQLKSRKRKTTRPETRAQ